MKLFSNYANGWVPDSGVVAYVEKSADKRVLPAGVLYEPDYHDHNQYRQDVLANADVQIPAWQAQGVNDFALNAEKCWRNGAIEGAQVVDAALYLIGLKYRGMGGAYGAFVDDSGADANPAGDMLGRNLIVGNRIGGSIKYVEVSVYPHKSKNGQPETLNGSMVEPVLRRAWHQVQQVRIMHPNVPVRLWVSDQCQQNGVPGPIVFIPPGEFGKTVAALARMPGVSALAHNAGYDDDANGGKGGGLHLTDDRMKCRQAFADQGTIR
jgi:hypothetical protein